MLIYSHRMKNYTFAIFIFILLSVACKNEIDINAPWRETPVVFGLLDANNQVQYLRIQKTYQNSVNQTTQQGARYSDSLYFDTLYVTVTSDFNETFIFEKIDTTKNDGFFANDKAVLYKANFKPVNGRKYTLNIFSPSTGKKYTSTTNVIGAAETTQSGSPPLFRVRNYPEPRTLRYTPGRDAFIYDIMIRLNYTEYNVFGDSLQQFIDYPVRTDLPIATYTQRTESFTTSNFLKYIAENISKKPGIERKFRSINYVFAGGSQDLKLFIDISRPINSFVQVKPEFSNIEGALGIFSSRSISLSANILLSDDSSRYFINTLPGFVP